MHSKIFFSMAPLAALTACAGDNPENVPLYGQWEMVTAIDSFTVDGMVIPAESWPAEFSRMAGGEGICGEPMFIDRDWQLADINSQVDGECTIDNYEVTERSVDGSGICNLSQNGLDFQPGYTIRISQQPDSYRMVITMEGSVVLPEDGMPHTLKIIAVQEGTRTGDC